MTVSSIGPPLGVACGKLGEWAKNNHGILVAAFHRRLEGPHTSHYNPGTLSQDFHECAEDCLQHPSQSIQLGTLQDLLRGTGVLFLFSVACHTLKP